MLLAAIVWAACGPVTALIASRYGSSVPLWFALGLLFGPFGLIFSLASGNDRICEHCGRHIDRAAVICPRCQGDISATAAKPPIYACASCGARYDHRPAFCPKCREPFHQAPWTIDRLVESKKVRTMYSSIAAWILLLGAMGVYASMNDPAQGHAGRYVYADEVMMDSPGQARGFVPAQRRAFRVAKDDHLVRMPEIPTNSPNRVWIRITSGTHVGRTGVMEW
jgi:RNA polymerase subunit RPABC4/transcription elongation factor Spt4